MSDEQSWRRAFVLAHVVELEAAHDDRAPVEARAALRKAEQGDDSAAIELWSAVCAIFEGERDVEN